MKNSSERIGALRKALHKNTSPLSSGLRSHRLINVGFGISPNRPGNTGFADYTAGGEFHPAPKILNYGNIILPVCRCGYIHFLVFKVDFSQRRYKSFAFIW